MLQWSGLRPYNAVHVIRIRAAVSPSRYEERLNHVIRACGLTNLTIDETRGTYCFQGGEAGCVPTVIEGGGDPDGSVNREMERQINDPFPHDRCFTPFRFFILPSDDETFLGIAYFHAIADADSIGRLLIEIVRSCVDADPLPIRDESLRPLRESTVPLGNPVAAVRRLVAAYRKFQNMRQSFRPPLSEAGEYRNEFFGRSLDQEQTAKVLATARQWEMTVNDLFLAALLKAVMPVTAERFGNRRKHLSVGCVVNLRRDIAEKRRRDFGLFLGSFAVTHPVPEGISFRGLAAGVRSQTLPVKLHRLYLAARLEFRISRFMLARMPVEKRRNFYRKVYPIWGSITNVKIDGLCAAPGMVPVIDYYRAVSAGPAMPFVISVTGLGGRLNFGVSYRTDVIPSDKIDLIIGRFIELLTTSGDEV